MTEAIRSIRLNYRAASGEAARPPISRPAAFREPVADRLTIEGIHLAREQNEGFTVLGLLLVYTAAITMMAFIAGQAFQQFMADARAYEIERRV